jgi:hypothetical protein
MFCCGRQENIEDLIARAYNNGEEIVGKSRKRRARLKSKEVGYV